MVRKVRPPSCSPDALLSYCPYTLRRTAVQLTHGWSSVRGTHKSNMHHFWVAYEAYLRLIQYKAALIEKHGFDGLWMTVQSNTMWCVNTGDDSIATVGADVQMTRMAP